MQPIRKTAFLTALIVACAELGFAEKDLSIADKEHRMEFRAEKRYLNLPVKNGAAMRRVRVLEGERILREFEIELAPDRPDFWVFVDLQPFRGKSLSLWVDQLPENSRAFENVSQDDAIRGAENLYAEKYRPQFHFSARRGWNNDPNGLVYHQGEYHLPEFRPFFIH